MRTVYWHTDKCWSKTHIISDEKPEETLCRLDWRQDRAQVGPMSTMPATCSTCLRLHAATTKVVATHATVNQALEEYDRAVIAGAPNVVEKACALAWQVREFSRAKGATKAPGASEQGSGS